MKLLFTLAAGMVLGWATALYDEEGQLALERHQLEVDQRLIYQAATPEVANEEDIKSLLLFWR